jgi:hypothetical protein
LTVLSTAAGPGPHLGVAGRLRGAHGGSGPCAGGQHRSWLAVVALAIVVTVSTVASALFPLTSMVWSGSQSLSAGVAVNAAVSVHNRGSSDYSEYRVSAGHSHGPPTAVNALFCGEQTYYVLAGDTPVLVHNCNVDYFDPDNDLLNAVHNQRFADGNRGNTYAAARYRDANGNEQIAVMHSDRNGHAEEYLVNSLGRDNILEVYSEFQPCQRTCTPLLRCIPTSWSWDWTTSAAGRAAQAARRDALDILFDAFGG